MEATIALRQPIFERELLQILKWRQDPVIKEAMFTEVSSMEQMLKWFETASHNHWMITNKGSPIGIVGLKGEDLGFYIGEKSLRATSGYVLAAFYNHIFAERPIQKLIARIKPENERMQRIQEMLGFQNIEGNTFGLSRERWASMGINWRIPIVKN